MLGPRTGLCDLGELYYMWSGGVLRDQRCACGETFSECPFWRDVGARALGGWSEESAREVLELQRRVDGTLRLPLHFLGRLLPAHRRAERRYLDLMHRVYVAAAAAADADVVVDSTKRPSTAFLLRSDPRIRLHVVHVVRDPRGVVNSWRREVALPTNAGPRGHLKARPMRQILRRWLTVNLMFEVLRRRGVPTTTIRYEDFVTSPRTTLSSVLALTGRRVSDEAVAFVGADGLVGAVHSHAATGGRVRFSEGPVRLRLDERWRSELPPSRQRLTSVLCRPLMKR